MKKMELFVKIKLILIHCQENQISMCENLRETVEKGLKIVLTEFRVLYGGNCLPMKVARPCLNMSFLILNSVKSSRRTTVKTLSNRFSNPLNLFHGNFTTMNLDFHDEQL